MRHVRPAVLVTGAAALVLASMTGCAAEPASGPPTPGQEQDYTSDAATLKLTADFKTSVTGEAIAGKGVVVEYAIERLPGCRGNIGGGGPAWNITGFYSENGSAAKTFEVSALSPDGNDRVAKPGRIVPRAGGDLAIWFQVTSAFGCAEYDSQYGQNFHVAVKGPVPVASASIVFGKSGSPVVTGKLEAGSKVKITYEQDRLPACRRVERGYPAWTITGFAQVDREAPLPFDTARPEGTDRAEIDALVELPHAGELSLWFQVASLGGCMQYDSRLGDNYVFRIEE